MTTSFLLGLLDPKKPEAEYKPTSQKRPPKRCQIYLRYDTPDTPAAKIRCDRIACEEIIKAHGWKVVSTIIEFGPGCSSKRNTSCILGILQAAEKGQIDLLVFPDGSHISTGGTALNNVLWKLAQFGVYIMEPEREESEELRQAN